VNGNRLACRAREGRWERKLICGGLSPTNGLVSNGHSVAAVYLVPASPRACASSSNDPVELRFAQGDPTIARVTNHARRANSTSLGVHSIRVLRRSLMESWRRRRVHRWLLILALCGSPNCHFLCGASPEAVEWPQADSHVYHGPMMPVWSALRDVLAERGYATPDGPVPANREVPSEWHVDSPSSRSRYRIRFLGVDGGDFTIELAYDYSIRSAPGDWQPTDTVTTGSNGDVTWPLLERVDPTAAARIRREASQHVDRARERQRAAERGCDFGLRACAFSFNACARVAGHKP